MQHRSTIQPRFRQWQHRRPRLTVRRTPKRIALTQSLIRYSLEFLINSGFHLGADSRRWFAPSSYYILARRKGVFLFDLTKSVFLLRRASSFISKLIGGKGKILFLLGETYSRYKRFINILKLGGHPVVSERYKAGAISNYRVVSPSFFSTLPSAVFVLDHVDSIYAVREASSLRLPVVGISDSDMDPSFFTYPLPGNNDSVDSVRFLLHPIITALAKRGVEELANFRKRQKRAEIRRLNPQPKKRRLPTPFFKKGIKSRRPVAAKGSKF